MNDAYSVAAVTSASCSDHLDVQVCSEDGDSRTFRTDVATGQAILAELHRVPSDRSTWVDLIAATIEALGAEISYVEIAAGEPSSGWVVLDTDERRMGIGRLPAGMALLVSTRLSLPVRIRASTATGVVSTAPAAQQESALPAAIQSFLEELALD